MTKIQITPKWSDVKPEGHYVYIHVRSDSKDPFYVGKGQNKRGWSKRTGGGAEWWMRIAQKHGVNIIIAQDGMDRDQSLLLEMWLIAKFRHDGFSLCNITEGGEGCVGVRRPWTRERQITMRDKLGGREIFCSNGENYDSCSSAARLLSESMGRKVSEGNILNVCNGIRKSYLGMSFSYDTFPEPPMFSGRSARSYYAKINHSKVVYSSLGEVFDSNTDAAMAMRGKGYPKATDVAISSCAIGKLKSAYGRAWSHDTIPPQPNYTGRTAVTMAKSKKVANDAGEIFPSATAAAIEMRSRGLKGASQGCISRAARQQHRTACGYKWRYIDG